MSEEIETTLARIVALADYQRMFSPAQGQFVVTGSNFQGDPTRVGYCVPARKRVGQFGSDMVFLRHANGSLTVHENNCYLAMDEEQEALARSVFEVLPEDEEYNTGYADCDGVREIGFVIENSTSHGPLMCRSLLQSPPHKAVQRAQNTLCPVHPALGSAHQILVRFEME